MMNNTYSILSILPVSDLSHLFSPCLICSQSIHTHIIQSHHNANNQYDYNNNNNNTLTLYLTPDGDCIHSDWYVLPYVCSCHISPLQCIIHDDIILYVVYIHGMKG